MSSAAAFVRESQVVLHRLVAQFGGALADAQIGMVSKAIELFEKMGEETVKVSGVEGERSLLELGFTPSFLQIRQATFQARLSLSIVEVPPRMEVGPKVTDVGSGLGLPTSLVNAGLSKRFSYPPEDASSLETTVAIRPGPQALLDQIRARQRSRARGAG